LATKTAAISGSDRFIELYPMDERNRIGNRRGQMMPKDEPHRDYLRFAFAAGAPLLRSAFDLFGFLLRARIVVPM